MIAVFLCGVTILGKLPKNAEGKMNKVTVKRFCSDS